MLLAISDKIISVLLFVPYLDKTSFYHTHSSFIIIVYLINIVLFFFYYALIIYCVPCVINIFD